MRGRRRLVAGAVSVVVGCTVGLTAVSPASGAGVRAASTQGAAVRAPSTQAQLQRLADRIVRAGAPGATILLRDGVRLTQVRSGVADVATGEAMAVDAAYRAGSVTKTVVATRVLQLVADKRLRLDAPVDRYLPGLLPAGGRITLRHLLQHTSGLFDYTQDPDFGAALAAGEAFTPDQLVRYSVLHPLEFAPGSAFSYSNTGYIVLGLLIRAVTGRGLAEELRDLVFDPAGMDRSQLPVRRRTLGPGSAHGHLGVPPSGALLDVTSAYSPSWAWGAGALVSNTVELADFYRSLLRAELTPRWLVRQMRSTTVQREDVGYGLGLGRFDLPCGETWGHDGLYVGYYTIALSTADGRRQLVVMMNVDPLNGAPPPGVLQAFGHATIRAFCGPASADESESVVTPDRVHGLDLGAAPTP